MNTFKVGDKVRIVNLPAIGDQPGNQPAVAHAMTKFSPTRDYQVVEIGKLTGNYRVRGQFNGITDAWYFSSEWLELVDSAGGFIIQNPERTSVLDLTPGKLYKPESDGRFCDDIGDLRPCANHKFKRVYIKVGDMVRIGNVPTCGGQDSKPYVNQKMHNASNSSNLYEVLEISNATGNFFLRGRFGSIGENSYFFDPSWLLYVDPDEVVEKVKEMTVAEIEAALGSTVKIIS